MRRDIRVRAQQKDPIDLDRLARALLAAARALLAEDKEAAPVPAGEVRGE